MVEMLKYCDSSNVIETHLVRVSREQFVYCFAYTYTPMRLMFSASAIA